VFGVVAAWAVWRDGAVYEPASVKQLDGSDAEDPSAMQTAIRPFPLKQGVPMSTTGSTAPRTRDERTDNGSNGRAHTARRLVTETKASFKTTEFFAYLAAVVGLLIAGNTIEGQEGGADYFAADKVWLYITLLTVGYMISRGLAKAGSSQPYDEDRS
jgi:hypothetical protein